MTAENTKASDSLILPKLTTLQLLHYRHPLATPIETTMGQVTSRPALILRIEDEEGAYGWGEIWCNFPPGGDCYRAELALSALPGVIKKQSLDTNAVFHGAQQALHRVSLQAGEPGPIAQLCAGLDIAVIDLKARRQGVPISTLIATDFSFKKISEDRPHAVKAYASGVGPAYYEQQMERMRSRGYQHFKQRIGFGNNDSIPQLQAAARGLQQGETLMADANQSWSLSTAMQRITQLESLELGWLEEPLMADAADYDWLSLTNSSATPLAGGENLRSLADFKKAIKHRTFSVYQPDVCKWGGLSGCANVAKQVIDSGQRYCPHFLGGGIGLLASAHLLYATGHDGMLEVDSSDNPLQEILAGRSLSLSSGLFQLGSGSGLGIEPDIETAKEYLVSNNVVAIQ